MKKFNEFEYFLFDLVELSNKLPTELNIKNDEYTKLLQTIIKIYLNRRGENIWK